jgi:multicomponent Na+:H+ antiporter subunit C
MSPWLMYASAAVLVIVVAYHAIFAHRRMVGKIVAANLAGSGVSLLFVSIARRAPQGAPDPVVHALVLTSIVVSVSATALALALLRRLVETSEAKRAEAGEGERALVESWENHCGG